MAASSSLPLISVFNFHSARTQPLDFTSLFKSSDDETLKALQRVTDARHAFCETYDGMDLDIAIEKAELYLPYLFGLIEAATSLPDDAPLPRLKISWTGTMGSKYNKKFFNSDHWHFEAVNTLTTYGMIYRSKANSLLSQMESDQEFLANAVATVRLLCTASGIFDYIKDIELSRWTQKPEEPLPEKYTEFYSILSTLCIVEASQIAIKKALLSGMSPTAISKLCLAVRGKYRFINKLLASPGFCDTFSMTALGTYCTFNDHIYEIFAYRLIGGSHAENGEYGTAIAFLNIGIEKSRNFDKVPKDKTAAAIRLRFHFEGQVAETSHLLATISRDNTSIYYQHIPPVSQLTIPIERNIVQAIPWQPPKPRQTELQFGESKSCSIM